MTDNKLKTVTFFGPVVERELVADWAIRDDEEYLPSMQTEAYAKERSKGERLALLKGEIIRLKDTHYPENLAEISVTGT